jgi:hypothetical protein
MSFHCCNELVFIGPGTEVKHPVESVYLELIPYHVSRRGAGAFIPYDSIVCDTLYCRNRKGNHSFRRDTWWDLRDRRDIPDDPWGE